VFRLTFSTWGESVALSVQSFAIVFAILLFRGRSISAVTYASLSFVSTALLLSPVVPLYVLSAFQVLAVPLVSVGKVGAILT